MTENQSLWGSVFFIASPSESANTSGERKAVEEVLSAKGSKFPDVPFHLFYTPVTSTDEVRERIEQAAKEKNRIVHFSGHGEIDTNGVPVFTLKENGEEKENGKEAFLTPDELAGFFKAKNIRCVIFNFCYSLEFAQKAAEYVECAIGITGKIQGEAAIDFAQGFYTNLRDKEPNQPNVFKNAFDRGKGSVVGDDREKFVILETSKLEVKLIEPTEGSSIPQEFEFSGTFRNLPEPPRMWLYVNADLEGKFYLVPIGNYTSKGTWKVKTVVGTEKGNNGLFRIGVIVVDEEVNADLRKTLSEKGIVRLDNLPSGKPFGDRPVYRQ